MHHKYPYGVERITFTEANRFIADVLHGENKNTSRKAIRNRIRRAQTKRELAPGDTFDAGEFFLWAIQQESWCEALGNVEGLPIAAFNKQPPTCIPVPSPALEGDKLTTFIPGDESERLELLHKLQVENRQLKDDNHALHSELSKCREKLEHRSYVNRNNAKQVGKRDHHGNPKKVSSSSESSSG